MSEQNVEIARRLTLALRQDDLGSVWDVATDLLDPNIEMDTTRLSGLALGGVYTGLTEVGRWWLAWTEAWGGLGEFGNPELIDAGEQVFTWVAQHELRGSGSGVQVEMPEYGWVMTVRNGKVTHSTLYLDRAEALEAAGLSE